MTKLNHAREVLRLIDERRRTVDPDKEFDRRLRRGEVLSVMDIVDFVESRSSTYPLDALEHLLLKNYAQALWLCTGDTDGKMSRCNDEVLRLAASIIHHGIQKYSEGMEPTLLVAITDFNNLIARRSKSVHDTLNQPLIDALAQLESDLSL